jgi:transcription initiation factor TFIIB
MTTKDNIAHQDKNWMVKDDINALCIRMGLTDEISYRIKNIYAKAKEMGLIQGRDPHSIVVAATYIACKESGIIQTLNDFASVLQVGRKQLARNYRLLISKLAIQIPNDDPCIFLYLLANRCKIRDETKRQAKILMNYSLKRDFPAGKNPMSVAASVLSIACFTTSEHRSQRSIAKTAGITDVTLRNRIKDLKALLYSNAHNRLISVKDAW